MKDTGALAGLTEIGVLTRLSVEETGFIARGIEFNAFLINPLIAVHAILLRIVPHRVVPPIEERLSFSLVYRIAVRTPGVLPDESTGDVVDVTVACERIQHDE
jgi:hypothetical protein